MSSFEKSKEFALGIWRKCFDFVSTEANQSDAGRFAAVVSVLAGFLFFVIFAGLVVVAGVMVLMTIVFFGVRSFAFQVEKEFGDE